MNASLGIGCLKKSLTIQAVLFAALILGAITQSLTIAAIGLIGIPFFQPISAIMARMKAINGHSRLRDAYDTLIAIVGFYFFIYFIRMMTGVGSFTEITEFVGLAFGSLVLIVPWFVRHHNNGVLLHQIPILVLFGMIVVLNVTQLFFDGSYDDPAAMLGAYGMLLLGPILAFFYVILEWREYRKALKENSESNQCKL